MNKVAHYLQEHLAGEVVTSEDARKHFSTDASIFTITPSIITYPRNESDVRKTARFTWQLAERGRVIPITPRGAGSDVTGGAIGQGIVMVFPAHMNRVLEFDSKSGVAVVEPGLNFGKLQQTLNTHGRFLPCYPASMQYSTIGGAIGNNAAGEKSVKYGPTLNFVKGLRFVLSNGEVIETKRLSKRELNKKMGLSSFEGEIYRSLDALIGENIDLVESLKLDVSKNAAGYGLSKVKKKDGSFDLTPLIVGSQGTLGIVTETSFATEVHNPKRTMIAAFCNDIRQAEDAIFNLRDIGGAPSALELVDRNLLQYINQYNPNQLKDIISSPPPKLVLLIEFDDPSDRLQGKLTKKTRKILERNSIEYRIETEEPRRDDLWKIRHAAATIVGQSEGNKRALPIIEDGIVPLDQLNNYIQNIYTIFKKNNLTPAIWGHGGDANLHVQPMLDLNGLGDRQKVFKLMNEYYSMLIELGGSTTAQNNDGRLRGPFLERLYGSDAYGLFGKVKAVFDPYGIMNPGVKLDVTLDDVKPLLRTNYSLNHLHDHLPRS